MRWISNFPGYYILIILIICPSIISAQQDEIDSLKAVLGFQGVEEKVRILGELSWYYKNIDIDSSFIYAKISRKLAESSENEALISYAYNNLANAYEAIGEMDSAKYFHEECLRIKTVLNDSLGLAATHNNLGILYDQMGIYNKSLDHYFKSLKIYEKQSDDPFQIAMVLGNIGIVYKKQKAYDMVLDYYKKALSIYDSVGSEFGSTVVTGNIASVLIYLKDFKGSLEYSKKALVGYEGLGYTRYIPYVHHNLGLALDSLGNYEEAKKYYLSAIQSHKKNRNFKELALTYLNLSGSCMNTLEFNDALKYSKKAIQYAKKSKAFDYEVQSFKAMAEAYAALDNYKSSYQNLLTFIDGNDSLFEENKTKQIFELKTKYESEKKEQLIDLQQAQLEKQDLAIQRNLILIIGLILAIVLVAAIFAIWRKRSIAQKNAELQREKASMHEAQIKSVIQSQEQERERFATDLHDGMGQLINALNLNIEGLKQSDNRDVEHRNQLYENSTEILSDIYEELRNIAFNLMPRTLVKQGLFLALDELAKRINQSGQLSVEFNVGDIKHRLNDIAEIALYRIIQEFISNIIKYARAKHVFIQFTTDNKTELTLTIEDDGIGYDIDAFKHGKGNGWKNINSRLNFINAVLEIDTRPGRKGSTVIINIPLKEIIADNQDRTEKALIT